MNLVDVKPLAGSDFKISQIAINPLSPSVTMSSSATSATYSSTVAGDELIGTAEQVSFTPTVNDSDSASVFIFNYGGSELKIMTDQTPTVSEIANALASELVNNVSLSERIEISDDGTNIIITEKLTSDGYKGLSVSPTMSIQSLTEDGDEFNTINYSINNELKPRDKNNDYSGRQGAGAEFIQMVTTINQTSTQDSLQLKLDALGISDSAFGEFSVDSTGLITMKQDGASVAIGQISLALFNNNRGLEPVGDNNYAKTNESGDAMYNKNNENTGKIENKTLELSTADLSESLVNLMIFQRAFEANAKSITTSDEILNALINLKR